LDTPDAQRILELEEILEGKSFKFKLMVITIIIVCVVSTGN
jgi:hypothetical protein